MDQSEWMIYLYKDVFTGKRKKLIYSLLNYDFVQYATVYEYIGFSSGLELVANFWQNYPNNRHRGLDVSNEPQPTA